MTRDSIPAKQASVKTAGSLAAIRTAFEKAGKYEGDVNVNISYDIIRQVSAQLYTNPRKAIEELVCNSYDAGASECHIKLPLSDTDALIVLDNGESMNLDGLRKLWVVAKSPKATAPDVPRIANNRLQIGKFGIGKLAAYALGKRLTHVATTGGITRVVSVGEHEIEERSARGTPSFRVFNLKESEARRLIEPFLGKLPRPWDRGWKTWTMALVEDVSGASLQQALKIGILKRMIATALPNSRGFKVVMDGETVPARKIAKEDIEREVNVLDVAFRQKLQDVLREYWRVERGLEKLEDVPRSLYEVKTVQVALPEDIKKQVPAIDVPLLGPVHGSAILAYQTLTTDKLGERGYVNHGFAIYVNGKLINPEDELFGVSQRSHSFWRRFLARLEIPGLDGVLLVQRNAVSEGDPKAQIAREMMRILFEFTRSLAQAAIEEEEVIPETFGSRIGKVSPMLAPLAVEGLSGAGLPKEGLSAVDVDFVSLSESSPAAQYSNQDNSIRLNIEHPIFDAVSDLKDQNQRQWQRAIGEIVAGGKVVQGYLIAKGVSPDIVADVEELWDASLRSAAGYIRDPFERHIKEIDEASYEGGTRFENAVVTAFRALRLVARHIGGADNPDGIVQIPVSGQKNLCISIEAKGTKGIITHKELSQATVARHEGDSGCTSSVAIAREYQVEGRGGKESGLIRETKGKLPLLTVPAIAKMLRLHKRRPFTYDKVAKILTTWVHPSKTESFIEETWKELPEMGLMRLILEIAHEKMEKHNVNLPDPGMLVDDPRLVERQVTKGQIEHILEALATTTGMIVIQDKNKYEFKMTAPVETVIEAMTRGSEDSPPAKVAAAHNKSE